MLHIVPSRTKPLHAELILTIALVLTCLSLKKKKLLSSNDKKLKFNNKYKPCECP